MMNILCATDDNYVPYCGIMLTSLFENNKNVDIEVYLMTAGLNAKNILDFNRLAKLYNKRIHIITVDNNVLKNCPIRVGDHVSIVTYYRLLAPILLPSSIDKILYLDCDMVINGSLVELYNNDIENYAFAAVVDALFQDDDTYIRLSYDLKKSYCNCGLLLINLDYWRKKNVLKRCLDYIDNNLEKIIFHDQDTLNVVLQDEKKLLPITYNFQTFFFCKNKFSEDFSCMVKKIIQERPIVLHFDGSIKVWNKQSKHPYLDYYLYYKKKSLWRKIPLIDNRTIKEKLISLRNELIWFLGLRKRITRYIIEQQKFKNKI